jgi:hypothetical protein
MEGNMKINSEDLFKYVVSYGSTFYFHKRENLLLTDSDMTGLSTFRGCEIASVGWAKVEGSIMQVFSVDWGALIPRYLPEHECWTLSEGAPINGTELRQLHFQSCNELSNATVYKVAVNPITKRVVSVLITSFWASDQSDVPRWHKKLLNTFPSEEVKKALEAV